MNSLPPLPQTIRKASEANDMDWLDRIAGGVRAQAWRMFWTLLDIAESSNDADARNSARAALDEVYGYQVPARDTATWIDALDDIF